MTPKGHLAQTDHPEGLGRALTHPWITTDFGEAMLELVTPPFQTGDDTLDFLRDLHRFVYEQIGEELLWATSMPCFLHGGQSVRIAQYGSSLSARMREVYRRGLSHRYGRTMQTIAGVHFNFSPPDAFWPVLRDIDGAADDGRALRDETFFGLLRNYRRYGWLVLYLFGASPAVCHTYFEDRVTSLPELLPGTLYGPHATTLRMSDIGYRNHRQAGLAPSMNSLDAYVADLERAMQTPEPDYERFGVKVDGRWQQLSASILQIENEFYGFVRPKRVVGFGERPNHALRARGVAYVEVRALDVDAFEPLGVGQEQMRFMESFLWYCLLQDSPPLGAAEFERCDEAHRLVAARGSKRRAPPRCRMRARPAAPRGPSTLCVESSRRLPAGQESRPTEAIHQHSQVDHGVRSGRRGCTGRGMCRRHKQTARGSSPRWDRRPGSGPGPDRPASLGPGG